MVRGLWKKHISIDGEKGIETSHISVEGKRAVEEQCGQQEGCEKQCGRQEGCGRTVWMVRGLWKKHSMEAQTSERVA